MKTILVCGSRDWTNFDIIKSCLEMAKMIGFDTIVEGEAKGADSMARDIGIALNFEVIKEPAEWEKYHHSAGPIRNAKMLEHLPTLCLAFHTDVTKSKGTANMIAQARKLGVPVILVDDEENLQVFLSSKVTWLTIAEVKIFLIDIVEKAFNTVSTGYTKEDAEEFLKGQGGFDAIHIS
jgi:hypothetical protein